MPIVKYQKTMTGRGRRGTARNPIVIMDRSRKISSGYRRVAQPVFRSAGERKGVDFDISQASGIVATTSTNANAQCLNLIETGAASYNRVGRKVKLLTLRLKGSVGYGYTSGTGMPASILRMVVVWDKQPNGATIPVWNDIFGITNQGGAESSTILAPVRYDNMSRFSVVAEHTFETGADIQTTTGITIPFDKFIKLGGRETVYSSTNNPMTIADIGSGALYVFWRAHNNGTNGAWDVDATSVARLRYVD